MIYELEAAYQDGLPSDEQKRCIETFFDSTNEFWLASGLETDQGTDEETQNMIAFFLGTVGDQLQLHIKQMILDWRDEGF